jgi:hypothetical protein
MFEQSLLSPLKIVWHDYDHDNETQQELAEEQGRISAIPTTIMMIIIIPIMIPPT